MKVGDYRQLFELKTTGRVVMAGHGIFRVGNDYWEDLNGLPEDTGKRPARTAASIANGPRGRVRPAPRPARKVYSTETGKAGAASLAAHQSGKFQVPQGMSTYVYCEHGLTMSNRLSASIAGCETGTPTEPVEVIRRGARGHLRRLQGTKSRQDVAETPNPYFVLNGHEDADSPVTLAYTRTRLVKGARQVHRSPLPREEQSPAGWIVEPTGRGGSPPATSTPPSTTKRKRCSSSTSSHWPDIDSS